MPTTPYPIENFGGLQLVSDPIEAGASAALDLSNAEVDRRGRIRTRPGVTRLTSLNALTANCRAIAPHAEGDKILAICNTGQKVSVDLVTNTGSVSTVSASFMDTTPTPGVMIGSPVKFGTRRTESTIVRAINPDTTPFVTTAASMFDPAGAETILPTVPFGMAVTPTSQRLVSAGFVVAGNGTPSPGIATLTGTTTSGSPTITGVAVTGGAGAVSDIQEGMVLFTFAGAFPSPAGGIITSVVGTTITMNGNAAASGAGVTLVVVNGSGSVVYFSDPGKPTVHQFNNYVVLGPGDGEILQAAVTWSDLVFVFKRTACWVFTGEATDADGNPIFISRRISLPDALRPPNPALLDSEIAAGPDGVYFLTDAGLYRISGDTPVRVPTPVDPILQGTVSDISSAFDSEGKRFCLGWRGKQLHISYNDAVRGGTTLVWNTDTNQWTAYDFEMTRPITFEYSGTTSQSHYAEGETIYRVDPSAADDNGTAITWSWKSGRYPLADPGRVAVTLESSLIGTGTVSLRLDSETYSNQSGSVTLGTAPVEAEGWLQKDQEGKLFQHTLSGSGPASVSRLTHYVSSVKPAGVQ